MKIETGASFNKETEAVKAGEIFSSTGGLGISCRQDGRLYKNAEVVFGDHKEVEEDFCRLVTMGEEEPGVSRAVWRGVVEGDSAVHIFNNELYKSKVEVALPLADFTGDPSWFIVMAKNEPGREQIVATDVMICETEKQREVTRSPVERVGEVLGKEGYSFVNYISEDQVDQVHDLWGETFGWKRQEVDNLRRRLDEANEGDNTQRDVWFSAVTDNGKIVSAAMAEGLTFPTASGGGLKLVESTEWKTKDEYAGKGLMIATLAMLNAQILADSQENTDGLPLVYAECNFQSRADRAGYGAGFGVPPRSEAPQILIQNVGVVDGAQVEKGKLRDFTFMRLPKDVIEKDYNSGQRRAMIDMTGIKTQIYQSAVMGKSEEYL